MPPLTGAQRWLAAATGLISTVLAVLGAIGSFSAVAAVAQAHGFKHPGQVPLTVDLGIAGLILADFLLTWLGIPFVPLRWLPWLFVGATVWFNMAASWGDPIGMAMHAAAPALLVTWVEGVRHATRMRVSIARRRHIEGSPLGRWLLAPVATARLWRVQQLWHVTSYADALALERRRLLARAKLRATHGLLWRWRAPVEERLALRLGLTAVESPPAEVEASRGDAVSLPEPTGPATSPGTALAVSPPRTVPASPRARRPASRGTKRPAAGPTKAEQIRAMAIAERAEGRAPSPGDIARVLGADKAQVRRVIAAMPVPNGRALVSIEEGRS
jgi:hypothetical protein